MIIYKRKNYLNPRLDNKKDLVTGLQCPINSQISKLARSGQFARRKIKPIATRVKITTGTILEFFFLEEEPVELPLNSYDL